MINKRFLFMTGLVVALFGVTQPAVAQVELGLDAGVQVISFDTDFDSDNLTQIGIPVSNLRVGFFISPSVEIEPNFSLQRASSGGSSATEWDIGANLLYHFGDDPAMTRFFVAFGPSLVVASGGDETDSQFGVTVGAGVKIPASDLLLFRLGAGYTKFFEKENELVGLNVFTFLFGFSVMVE